MRNENIIHLSDQISSPKLQDSLGCFGALCYKVGKTTQRTTRHHIPEDDTLGKTHLFSSYYTITAPTIHKDFTLVL
jgi:hypothetical protein